MADDLPLTGKVAATEVADGKRERATFCTVLMLRHIPIKMCRDPRHT